MNLLVLVWDMLLDSFLYLEYLKLDHCYLLPISLPELFVSSHGGTMTMSLMHQWHDTICGGVIGPRRSLLYGAYGCILDSWKSESDELSEYINTPAWNRPLVYCDNDDDEDYTIAITPESPTKEPVNSLSLGDEHLDTIPETESDEFIKSSVENLVPIPQLSSRISDDEW
ncbi:hypothetical protein Tco_0493805 [Tanacetum coccineum]